MRLLSLLALAALACSPPKAQPTVEITPLPVRAPTSSPPALHHHAVTRPTSGPDRDGDGILDDFDKCPDEPEDRDGFEDSDGCPDPDNDQDGIRDVDDQCPNEPGPPPTGCP
jgi:hypothetical protein